MRAGVVVACVLLAACAAPSDDAAHKNLLADDNLLHSTVVSTSGEIKNAATLRILPYVDQRKINNPHLLGVNATRVFGLSGNTLAIDSSVADITTLTLQNQFRKMGFDVQSADAAAAFELSGTIRELTVNTRDRDDALIVIDNVLKDTATGKVVWSAAVTEKNDRFAGISGDTRNDVVEYLNHELRVVSGKTVDAVNTFLMATYPALYHLTPGTHAIAGVDVHSAPVLAPVAVIPAVPVPAPAVQEAVATTMGMLRVSSVPTRAKVYLDGIYFGMTPLQVDLEAGIHQLDVKLSGYQTDSEKISVRKTQTTEIEVNLAR